MSAGATYCAQCGARVGTAVSVPPPPPAMAPPAYPSTPTPSYGPPVPHEPSGTLVAIVVLVVVIAIVAVAVMFWMTSAFLSTINPGHQMPKAIGVVVAKSTDGTNWTLTFVSVPTGLTPSTTYMALTSASGMSIMSGMALSTMTGGVVMMQGGAGRLYLQYQGITSGVVSARDTIQIGTAFAGTSTSTTGCGVQLSSGSSILFSGTLI